MACAPWFNKLHEKRRQHAIDLRTKQMIQDMKRHGINSIVHADKAILAWMQSDSLFIVVDVKGLDLSHTDVFVYNHLLTHLDAYQNYVIICVNPLTVSIEDLLSFPKLPTVAAIINDKTTNNIILVNGHDNVSQYSYQRCRASGGHILSIVQKPAIFLTI